MVIFWITFQNISVFLWISFLPEPTVPLFFRRLETSWNTSYFDIFKPSLADGVLPL